MTLEEKLIETVYQIHCVSIGRHLTRNEVADLLKGSLPELFNKQDNPLGILKSPIELPEVQGSVATEDEQRTEP